jgi:hypothetical protein
MDKIDEGEILIAIAAASLGKTDIALTYLMEGGLLSTDCHIDSVHFEEALAFAETDLS